VTRLASAVLFATACSGTVVQYEPVAVPPAPSSDLAAALYLVGDAGEDSPGRDSVLAQLGRDIDSTRARFPMAPILVAFLGDNIYDVGARAEFKEEDLAQLTAQVAALGAGPDVRGVFLPGNHDWAKGADIGRAKAAIRAQQAWLREISFATPATLLPGDACPGPATVDLTDGVHLVFIDTEWLLRYPPDDCGTPEAFYERLRVDLADNADKRVVIATHHPLATGGPHGGNVGPLEHGPFLYYLASKSGLSVQDLASPRYSAMGSALRGAIAASGVTPLAVASGHDHSLQVIAMGDTGEPAYQLVSGSASKWSPARRIEGTRYAASAHGFMRLDFRPTSTRLVVFGEDGQGRAVRPLFACAISVKTLPNECPEASRLDEE
jgi:hypothetical protein